MPTDSSQPNTADIRQVLLKSFRDEELTALCLDYFPDVYDVFFAGTTKEQKIQLLIEHCVQHELIPDLLSAIQRSYPRTAKSPFAYPLKNPLPFLLGGVGVVLLVIVAVLISRIPGAAPVPPTQRPTVRFIVDATLTPTVMRPTNTPVPGALTPTNTPLPPAPTLKPTATPAPGATRIADKDGMVMVYVPAGEFLMGSVGSDKDAESDEKPQHKVYLDAFWIDKTEVTNAQYNKCVQAGACTASAYANNSTYNGDNQPVVGVDWRQAQAYCQWAGRQLPTEAQWEKAARGTDGRIYPWGNQPTTCEYAVINDGSGNGCGRGAPWPVGSKPKGASPYGALDMAGNVWEWVADWYDDKYYASFPLKNPLGPLSGQYRVMRGGSWLSIQTIVRAAKRLYFMPDDGNSAIGFRCAGVGPGG